MNNTQISELPSKIDRLSNLTYLSLSSTLISKLPTELFNLTNLESLDLDFTAIRELPSEIGQLKKIRYLLLSGTYISELPPELGKLTSLTVIGLQGVTLPNLPSFLLPWRFEYSFKDKYYISSNTPVINIQGLKLLQQPVSLFMQPRELIEDYYRQPHVQINESKVIFLGSEGVGKTHTIKRILNDNHIITEVLKETPGISITSRKFNTNGLSYSISFWDFGGQEIMHAMHRCFLTDRTGYVIVVSTRFGDVNKQARYWLKSIESFTKNAPVVVYLNIWSDGTMYSIDEYSLRRDYPNIIEIRQCSAKDGTDEEFSKVVSAIQEMALLNDSITMSFPESWEKVRQDIIDLGRAGSGKFYISLDDYRKKCRENGIENEDIQTWLLDWFNDLGECFSYSFEDKQLAPNQDFKVLNPEWLTNAIYIIIREARDVANNGTISHTGVRNKLDHSDKGTLKDVSYNKDECNYVLEVMRKFKLSYKVPGSDLEFIPALLNNETPANLENGSSARKNISYEMRYKYLPENVIHNLMIEMYQYLDIEKCWRKGMVIDARRVFNSGLYAILDMSRDNDILKINVFAYADYAPWQLLQEIRTRLLEINSRMNLAAEDYILVDPSHCEYARIDKLLKLKRRGVDFLQGEDNNYDINLLLGETFGDEQVRRLDGYAKGEEDYETGGPIYKPENELDISTMKEVLKQPEEKRLFNSPSEKQISCQMICEALLSACLQIQADPKCWEQNEDSRSIQVRTILRNRNFYVSDQTQYGNAPGGRNPGEIDLMVMKNTTDPLTIIEAMNLRSVDSSYIHDHLSKLLDDYNPNGLNELFLVAYVQKAKHNFQKFWASYLEYINGTDAKKFKFSEMEELETAGYNLKHVLAKYDCGGAVYKVHHICMWAGD